MSNAAPSTLPDLATRLCGIRVGVRADLEASRHVFRCRPYYIVRDPLTFQSQRFEPADYAILCRIRPDESLGVIFEQLVADGTLTRDDEQRFYEFVFSLHRLTFLNLPISDEALLYKRHEARRRQVARQRWLSVLFLQIPLVNPDSFLRRTLPLASWLFTEAAFAAWCALIVLAGSVAFARSDELFQPLTGILASSNLFVMWATLVTLKALHELGHAYACRAFGGHVPEMGVFLILFTPCAYVDATASWGFPSKWHRLVVCLAGMYVESICASIAVFVWAFTEPGLINAIAFNVIFLASTTTILFNINPLMRYDGYYILTDLIETPNLRKRSQDALARFAKRILLGIAPKQSRSREGRSIGVAVFGAAGAIYKVLLTLGIGAALSLKFGMAGMIAGALYVCFFVVRIGRMLFSYLTRSEETAPIRGRAVMVGMAGVLVVASALFAVPIRFGAYCPAAVRAETQVSVRTRVPGFVERVSVRPEQTVDQHDPLCTLVNDDTALADTEAGYDVDRARLLVDATVAIDPARAVIERERLKAAEAAAQERKRDADSLRIVAPIHGRVAGALRERNLGAYLPAGTEIALLMDGPWQVQAYLSENEFTEIRPRLGDRAEFRAEGTSEKTLGGTIVTIEPAGRRLMEATGLTQLGGGGIAVDPLTNQASQPYFRVTLMLDREIDNLRIGMKGVVRFETEWEPMGLGLVRRVLRFAQRVTTG